MQSSLVFLRFQPLHQQEELIGVMLLRSSRANGSSLCKCECKDLIQSGII